MENRAGFDEDGEGIRKGPWTKEEDLSLISYISIYGDARWDALAKASGLKRSGKSCRLRWVNYLRPDLKRGKITAEEERLIIDLHKQWGNRWSKIAEQLPGRTDNYIKNYYRSHVRRKNKRTPIEEKCNNIVKGNPTPNYFTNSTMLYSNPSQVSTHLKLASNENSSHNTNIILEEQSSFGEFSNRESCDGPTTRCMDSVYDNVNIGSLPTQVCDIDGYKVSDVDFDKMYANKVSTNQQRHSPFETIMDYSDDLWNINHHGAGIFAE